MLLIVHFSEHQPNDNDIHFDANDFFLSDNVYILLSPIYSWQQVLCNRLEVGLFDVAIVQWTSLIMWTFVLGMLLGRVRTVQLLLSVNLTCEKQWMKQIRIARL